VDSAHTVTLSIILKANALAESVSTRGRHCYETVSLGSPIIDVFSRLYVLCLPLSQETKKHQRRKTAMNVALVMCSDGKSHKINSLLYFSKFRRLLSGYAARSAASYRAYARSLTISLSYPPSLLVLVLIPLSSFSLSLSPFFVFSSLFYFFPQCFPPSYFSKLTPSLPPLLQQLNSSLACQARPALPLL